MARGWAMLLQELFSRQRFRGLFGHLVQFATTSKPLFDNFQVTQIHKIGLSTITSSSYISLFSPTYYQDAPIGKILRLGLGLSLDS